MKLLWLLNLKPTREHHLWATQRHNLLHEQAIRSREYEGKKTREEK